MEHSCPVDSFKGTEQAETAVGEPRDASHSLLILNLFLEETQMIPCVEE